MADEATDALIPEAPSPEVAAPTEAPAPDPYEKRYNDLRSDYDRRNSLLDRARNGDIDAIRELGFEVDAPDPTPEEEYDDPYAAKLSEYEKQIAELSQWKQQQEAEKAAISIRSHVDSLASQAGVELTDRDKEIIFSQAVGGDSINPEATEAAFKAHLEWRNALLESVAHRETPDRPGTGQAAIKQFDPVNATDEERLAYMEARLKGAPVT